MKYIRKLIWRVKKVLLWILLRDYISREEFDFFLDGKAIIHGKRGFRIGKRKAEKPKGKNNIKARLPDLAGGEKMNNVHPVTGENAYNQQENFPLLSQEEQAHRETGG